MTTQVSGPQTFNPRPEVRRVLINALPKGLFTLADYVSKLPVGLRVNDFVYDALVWLASEGNVKKDGLMHWRRVK